MPIINDEVFRQAVRDEISTLVKQSVTAESHRLVESEYLKLSEACKVVGVSEPTFYKWIQENNIKKYRVLDNIRYKKSELIRAIEETVF